MKRLLLSVLLAGGLAASAVPAATPKSADGREKAIAQLKETWKTLEKETKGLTPEQWNFKPAPDRWSVAETYEHLAAAEDLLFNLITERVLKTPAAPEKKDPAKQAEGDERILKMIADRSNRVQAPEPLRPTNRFGSVEETRKKYKASRQRTIDFAKKTPVDLRAHFMDSPVMPAVDGTQWLLFIAAHTTRHTAQIREVKADPNFPKKKSRY
jgi:uncharacterized damage-inducible protein DinB